MKDLPRLKLTVATKEIQGGGAENAIFLNFIHKYTQFYRETYALYFSGPRQPFYTTD